MFILIIATLAALYAVLWIEDRVAPFGADNAVGWLTEWLEEREVRRITQVD